MLPPDLVADAAQLLSALRAKGVMLATAESCTGGLIAAVLTEVPGSSDVLDRGFVTYSNAAKTELLGVEPSLVARVGAVSPEVAAAMAAGALRHAQAGLSIAVTGIAGPGGGTAGKPIGLVHLAAARRGGPVVNQECRFGSIGRHEIRLATVGAAFALLRQVGLEA